MNPLCSVTHTGLELRSSCATCTGRPTQGQLMLRRNQQLYLEGEAALYVYAVVSGYVREARMTPDGRTQGVRLVGPGEVTGLEALRAPYYRSSAETLSRARVCRIPRRDVEMQLRTHADQAMAMVGALVDELTLLKDTVLWITVMSAEERILALLRRLSEAQNSLSFRLPITRLEMARLLGLSHSTVSRTLHRLAKSGAISLEGRMVRLP